MFWGLILKANKKYTQITKQSFHISQAALDVTSAADGPIQLFLTYENTKHLICTLRKNVAEQVMLDLNFNEGDEISLQSQGNGTIHISGYVTELNNDEFDYSDDESETEGIKPTKVVCPRKTALRKKIEAAVAARRDNDDDEDDSDFKGEGEVASSESGSGSETDDDSEGDSGEEEEEGEREDEDGEDVDDDEEDESEDEEVQQPKAKQPKLEKPKQNGVETQKKEKDIKPQKKEKKEQPKQKTGETIVLSGGVKIEDLRVGNGPESKPGKKALVYYEGRLKSNNKVFDSLKQGTPFKFIVGRGDVIKGWDLGVPGMKVGGKRRITCPPHMAYGARGSPPTIPANSTLVFEVELKGVQ